MKIIAYLTGILALCLLLFISSSGAEPKVALTETITINTTATADLKGDSITYNFTKLYISRQADLYISVCKTNGVCIDAKTVQLSAEQLKEWINADDPNVWLQSFALGQVGLAKK